MRIKTKNNQTTIELDAQERRTITKFQALITAIQKHGSERDSDLASLLAGPVSALADALGCEQ